MVTALCSQQRAFGDHPVTVLSRLQAGNVASSTHFWIFAYDLKAFPRFWIHGSTHFWIFAYDLKAFPRFGTHGPSLVHNSVLLGIIRSLDRVGYSGDVGLSSFSTHFWIFLNDLVAFPRVSTYGPSLVRNSVRLDRGEGGWLRLCPDA